MAGWLVVGWIEAQSHRWTSNTTASYPPLCCSPLSGAMASSPRALHSALVFFFVLRDFLRGNDYWMTTDGDGDWVRDWDSDGSNGTGRVWSFPPLATGRAGFCSPGIRTVIQFVHVPGSQLWLMGF